MKILRVFAGPNGSGKSTITRQENSSTLGIYLNADEVERLLRIGGKFSLNNFQIRTTEKEFKLYLRQSSLFVKFGSNDLLDAFQLEANELRILNKEFIDSRLAQMIIDFSISKLLESRQSFSFETVMSHQSKIEILKTARSLGYEVILYFIATDDSSINAQRVHERTTRGGHHVPKEKIIERYERSLSLLFDALLASSITHLYDNSGRQSKLIAKVYDGKKIVMEVPPDEKPNWFIKYVEDKISK